MNYRRFLPLFQGAGCGVERDNLANIPFRPILGSMKFVSLRVKLGACEHEGPLMEQMEGRRAATRSLCRFAFSDRENLGQVVDVFKQTFSEIDRFGAKWRALRLRSHHLPETFPQRFVHDIAEAPVSSLRSRSMVAATSSSRVRVVRILTPQAAMV